jgi:phenylalanyl-tRNA synthetase beta chain
VKLLVSWLSDFVDVKDPPEELGRRLSMVGFELASLEKRTGDAVLDFEILANRPDALSVLGLAREAATAYSLRLVQPGSDQLKKLQKGPADVAASLEAPDLCARYSAAVADVTIGPSPAWLSGRLLAAGVRPINNVVDVTNYVLLELGQPMHAFDLEKLAGRTIRIRRANGRERITTLDGVDRALEQDMLVIADAERAQAVAGVMGGGLSEVSHATKAVVLESACFRPKTVRLTSKKLGVTTEASARFERGTDPNATVAGIERACALLEEIGAGTVRGSLVDEYPEPVDPKRLALRRARIERVLGQTIPDAEVERILPSLGFTLSRTNTGWELTVPTFRVDVSREADLIEEVGRHYGYDRLPATFPALEAPPPAPDPRIERDRLVRRILVAAGCSEAVSFSFIALEAAGAFAEAPDIVPISNPLTTQFAVMRPSLVPGLLAALAHNRHRERPDVRLFEIGAVITRSGEHRHVAVVWTGAGRAPHWSGEGRRADFFDVKGLVEQICEALNVRPAFAPGSLPRQLVPGRAATISTGGEGVGSVGMLGPSALAAAGLATGEDVYAAELNLDLLSKARPGAHLTITPPPRYPSIARDISIVVGETLPAETVRGTIRSAAPETLASVGEFDRYQGKGVPDGRVSLSLRLTFRSSERTLTDAEVEAAIRKIIAALNEAHNAVQR